MTKSTAGSLEELQRLRAEANAAGGSARIAAQHEKGKLTARERLALLLDRDSFEEIDAFVRHRTTDFGMSQHRPPTDGVVTGAGTIDGRPAYVFAQDFTIFGGSLSLAHGRKIVKIMDLALKHGVPLIGLNDSGGARIQEGVASLGAYAEIFLRNTLCSGVIPQISAILGPCAGGAVYSPAITDFIFMVDGTSRMYITGPDVVKAETGEAITHEALGGAGVHSEVTGIAHFSDATEPAALTRIRRLFSYLPLNNIEDPPALAPTDDPERLTPELDRLIPDEPSHAYDMRAVITHVVDRDSFLEIHENFAGNLLIGMARLDGLVIGVVAQQPLMLAGALDSDASIKGARFIRFCDAFNIPLVSFVDVPGFLPGSNQEHRGIILHGAKLLYAYCEATVPKLTLITRKAYGGAYDVMSSKHIRGDVNLAWPTAEIAVMGAAGAVNVIYRAEIAAADDPDARRRELIADYEAKFATPYEAAERGYVDAVIEPSRTRAALVRALRRTRNKRDTNPPRKHGNVPL